MPLEVPNLDDLSFTDLVQEALSMLPRCAPEWTNHNPSDPGVTLIELLAYFTELLLYRLNRVTRENKIKFLKLLRAVPEDEESWLRDPGAPVAEVDERLRLAVLDLGRRQRAVTPEDYEWLARALTADNPEGARVSRAQCFSGINLGHPDVASRDEVRPGHISLVIVPESKLDPESLAALIEDLRSQLDPMRLITTRLHVVKPRFLWVSLGAVLWSQPEADFGLVRREAVARLKRYFDARPGGGPDGEGWPFGRTVYLSEIYEQLEMIEEVHHVELVSVLGFSTTERLDERTALGIQIGVRSTVGIDTRLGAEARQDGERLIRDGSGRLVGLALKPYELVRITVREHDLTPGGTDPFNPMGQIFQEGP